MRVPGGESTAGGSSEPPVGAGSALLPSVVMVDRPHEVEVRENVSDVESGGVLVVRTRKGWNLTLASGRQPVPVSDAAVHALMRSSGGAQLADGDTGRSELTDAGVDLPSPSSLREPAAGASERDSGSPREFAYRPVPFDMRASSVPVFVGRVLAGSLLVEGDGARRELLDEIDVVLVESLGVESTVGRTVDQVRAVLGSGSPDVEELTSRLRRLADVGCILLDGNEAHDAIGEPPAVSVETEATESGARGARSRRLPFRTNPARSSHRMRRLLPIFRGTRAGIAATGGFEGPSHDGAAPGTVQGERHQSSGEPADDRDVAAQLESRREVTYVWAPDLTEFVDGAIPVYSVFPVDTGPQLSLGMLLAQARAWKGGILNRTFELRRMEDPDSCFADLEKRTGPAILLLSNYLWSLDHNLGVARRVKAMNPDVVVVHGGPSTPKYEVQCAEWFAANTDIVDVAVRGEGEITIVEALDALGGSLTGLDLARLSGISGLTFRHPDGRVVRNDDRERMSTLDHLPSPYLTGEFDHLHSSAWTEVIIETNRGCPYGCTFCDWGSSTLSRIRKFDIDRVAAEMNWAGERQFEAWVLGDANFGIMSRDVAVAEKVVEVKKRWGAPHFLGFNLAKNTTKHLTAIVDNLVKAGISPVFTLALQTRDEATLEAVRRTNISTEHYMSLASSLRRRGLPLRADIMIGLPGQTLDSLCGDLQFLMDHEVPARLWITQLLPNAPINDPAYRADWGVTDDHGVVISTKSFSADDRAEMLRIRHAYTVFEQLGLLRHVTRYLQWDHGIDIMTVIRRVVTVSDQDPHRYPLLNWTMRYFDYFNASPVGWRSFYQEVRRFLFSEFGVGPSQALDTVLEVQEFLMPEIGRSFPASIALHHDYVRYFQDRTRPLWMGKPAATSGPKLSEYSASRFTVYGDPLSRCSTGTIKVITDPRNESMTDDFWLAGHWEMDSPLVVNQPQVAGSQSFIGLLEQVPPDLPDEPVPTNGASVRINLARSSVSGSSVDERGDD